MFKFVPIETFEATVKVVTPAGAEQQFTAVFAYLDDAATEAAVKLTNNDLLRQVWVGWQGIAGPDDKELPFSEAQRELFLNHSYIINAVVPEFVRARQGLRAKN